MNTKLARNCWNEMEGILKEKRDREEDRFVCKEQVQAWSRRLSSAAGEQTGCPDSMEGRLLCLPRVAREAKTWNTRTVSTNTPRLNLYYSRVGRLLYRKKRNIRGKRAKKNPSPVYIRICLCICIAYTCLLASLALLRYEILTPIRTWFMYVRRGSSFHFK